ncbi:MAG: NUDIX domain-containing protein [Patescibacteria group bacterium]
MMNLSPPAIGVATVVVYQNKIAIGRDTRKGQNVYGVPGGHWESGETLKECAIRETKEECGLDIANPRLISVYDFYRPDKKKSYVTIGMKADYLSGQFTNLENEGRLQWSWYSIEEALKLNLFPPDRILIERYISGIIFE